MKLEYADLLSGDSILISGVGHIRSPKLKELKPTSGVGFFQYSLYLNLFAWDKEQFLKYAKLTMLRGLKAFEGQDQLECFDVITLIPATRELLRTAISFFMDETIAWKDSIRGYEVLADDGTCVGKINRDNFKEFSSAILQLNYIKLDKDKAPEGVAASKRTQELWDKAQQHLEKQSKQNKQENSAYSIGNIISKLCATHTTYNLLNVYELTVFQLYDQFFQMSYLRTMDINDRIFTIHGGDSYKQDEWVQPINKN